MQQCNKRLDPDQGRLGPNIFAKLISRRQEREILRRHQKRCNRVFKGCLFKVWIKIRAYPLPDLGPNILAKIFSREREILPFMRVLRSSCSYFTFIYCHFHFLLSFGTRNCTSRKSQINKWVHVYV